MTRTCLLKSLTFSAIIVAAQPAWAFQVLPADPVLEGELQSPLERIVPPDDEPLAKGEVVEIDRAAGTITLDYQPIPQPFLEGGQRIFRVKDPTTLKGLKPGDKVRFDVERDGRTYVVRYIENSN